MRQTPAQRLDIKLNILLLCLAALLILSPVGALAVESMSRDAEHRGVIELGPYQIFPENRMGNGIYLAKKLLDSHPQRVILKIVSVENTKSHVYLYRGQNGVLGLDIVKIKTDGDVRFWQVDPEFYQYSNRTMGILRVFRIFNGDIKPILSFLRTGTGIATSAKHAVFYHVSNSKDVTHTTESGQTITQRVYTFRLHVIKRGVEGFTSIFNLPIKDVNYRLKLVWEDEYTISYKLSNGKKFKVDLRKYLPKLF
ncbi:MAG: hypothetical protein H8E38_08445 [SAR324 cluster bacterium]|nr:hypothetical protein [SAR324 cluster bacterium]